MDVAAEFFRRFDPEVGLPVEVTESAAVIGTSLGSLEDDREILVRGKDADRLVNVLETFPVVFQGGWFEGDDPI